MKNSRPKVFAQPIRKLSVEEVQAVSGAGPFEVLSGPKSTSDVDNQGKNFN
jgi:hypothetical protein